MTKGLLRFGTGFCLLVMAALGHGERADAAGLAGGAAALAEAGDKTILATYGKKRWRHRRVEPPYAFYPPPRVGLRCFKSRYGYGNCPYAAWGKKDTGSCWYEDGRRVCGPAFYRKRYPGQYVPAFKAPTDRYYFK